MAKKIDPKAKAKRQKIIAAVGGVILLGVLAFQVPRTMKMLNQSSGSSSTSTPAPATTTTSSGPIAAPSLGGGNATASTAAATGGDGLSDPDATAVAASGQLLAFGLFRSKDPFVQQLTAKSTAAAPKPAAASGATGASGATAKPTAAVVSASPPAKSGGGASTPAPAPAKPAAPTSAVISVNGSPETIQVGGTFPASQPFFKLVSLTAKSAKIGIAGGTLETGAATVTLTKGKALTLMNTADGTRYVLRLVSVS
jgi:hypothetical protein